MKFELLRTNGAARRGRMQFTHGAVETPAFMPVGTAATVKAIEPCDLHELDAQIILANTYHLWLRPGAETITQAGGLHRFMAWDRPLLTDSGGFQVFSLESRRALRDDGVTFRSHIDGSEHTFTPENVVAFQEALGVDIAMALDVCVKLPAAPQELQEGVRRTTEWAKRCSAAWRRGATELFGIVQGGLSRELRTQSAAELTALDFAGYAIGGLSVGESREEMVQIAGFTAALLPPERPRYLMGVGTIVDLIEGVNAGIDMFDCVYPTRCGRNGRAITRSGEFAIRNAPYVRDYTPIDPDCACRVCATYTRAYLAHLFRSDEMLGPRLLSYHNLAVLLRLMREAREAIERERWSAFRDEVRQKFASPAAR